jgi:hypothetical protein
LTDACIKLAWLLAHVWTTAPSAAISSTIAFLIKFNS